jgi:hypothetical protein
MNRRPIVSQFEVPASKPAVRTPDVQTKLECPWCVPPAREEPKLSNPRIILIIKIPETWDPYGFLTARSTSGLHEIGDLV